MRSSRHRKLGHAAVGQVFRAKVSIDMDEDPGGGLSPAGMAGHGKAMIEMWMLLRIEADAPSTLIHLQLSLPVVRDTLYGSALTVRNLQVVRLRGRGELKPVAD
jgi:hypothetical protein